MVSYTEARKKKEKFRKYRESIEAKAKKSVEHQAKIWILLERNGRFYPISYPKNVSAVLDVLQFRHVRPLTGTKGKSAITTTTTTTTTSGESS
jgi:hypothetical protein